MSNFKAKDKSIIPEFVSALMKAYARRGASKTLDMLKKDPVIKQSLQSIEKLDKSLKSKIINAQKKTLNNKSISLVIAFDYGGRNEISKVPLFINW